MMAGYLDAQMRQRLAYLCKDLVEPQTTQGKIVSLALVATQKTPIANKGSIANNPFRMLPPEIMSSIRDMRKSWTPTPSALTIKKAGLTVCYGGFTSVTNDPSCESLRTHYVTHCAYFIRRNHRRRHSTYRAQTMQVESASQITKEYSRGSSVPYRIWTR